MQVVSYISTTWQAAIQYPDFLRHKPDHVLVVLWPVSVPISNPCWKTLDMNEQHRADMYIRNQHRERFVAAHYGVRRLLAEILDCDARTLRFVADANGKPQLSGYSIQFNLTHSGNWAALAITPRSEVGIDVEMIRPVERSLPQHYFSSREQAILATLKNEDWLHGFFRCWTSKEALLKAVGAGLSLPLDSFSVAIESNSQAFMLESSLAQLQPRDWSMLRLGCIPGYLGSLAFSSCLKSVSVLVLAAGINDELATG